MTIYNVKTPVVSLIEAPDRDAAAAAHTAHLLSAGLCVYEGEPIDVMESEPLPADMLPFVLTAPRPVDPAARMPVYPVPVPPVPAGDGSPRP